MKKLDSKGFAHQVLILALVVVAVTGGIGSYIYLRSSSAATGKSITIQPTDWQHRNKAKIVSDQSKKVVRVVENDTNSTVGHIITSKSSIGGTPLAKLTNFLTSNAGKKINVCVKARGGSSGVSIYRGLYYSSGAVKGQSITLKKTYSKYCKQHKIPSSITQQDKPSLLIQLQIGAKAYIQNVTLTVQQ